MSEEFEHKVHKEFNLVHRQLADHGQMLGELKAGQQKLEAGQQKLEAGFSGVKAEIGELRADMMLMDSKLNFLCDFIRRQMEDEGDE